MNDTATPPSPGMSRFWYAPYVALAVPAGCLLWSYWTTLADLAQVWNSNPQYSHGFLVPLFAAALLYLRRDKLDVAALRPTLWGVPVVLAALGLRLAGTYFYFISLDAISLVPCVAGLALML